MSFSYRALGLFLLLLSSCGGADQINTDGLGAKFTGEGQGQIISDEPRGPSGESTRVRIACEYFSSNIFNVLLTNSFSNESDTSARALEPVNREQSFAPVPLLSTESSIRVLHVSKSKYYLSEFDIFRNRENEELRLSLGAAPSASSRELIRMGYGRPRTAAASPGQNYFILGVDRKYSLRALQNPEKEILRWNLNPARYVNPRWVSPNTTYEWVFFDLLSDKLRQAYGRLDKNKKIIQWDELPTPELRRAHQIGLTLFNEHNLIWLEWNDGRALVRMMDIASRKDFSFPIEGDAFGPGFAVYRQDKIGTYVVLGTQQGLQFYSFAFGKLKKAFELPFTASILKNIRNTSWKVGPLYSAANQEQLFIPLPHSIGSMLYAVDRAGSFRRLGAFECKNPGFLDEWR